MVIVGIVEFNVRLQSKKLRVVGHKDISANESAVLQLGLHVCDGNPIRTVIVYVHLICLCLAFNHAMSLLVSHAQKRFAARSRDALSALAAVAMQEFRWSLSVARRLRYSAFSLDLLRLRGDVEGFEVICDWRSLEHVGDEFVACGSVHRHVWRSVDISDLCEIWWRIYRSWLLAPSLNKMVGGHEWSFARKFFPLVAHGLKDIGGNVMTTTVLTATSDNEDAVITIAGNAYIRIH